MCFRSSIENDPIQADFDTIFICSTSFLSNCAFCYLTTFSLQSKSDWKMIAKHRKTMINFHENSPTFCNYVSKMFNIWRVFHVCTPHKHHLTNKFYYFVLLFMLSYDDAHSQLLCNHLFVALYSRNVSHLSLFD